LPGGGETFFPPFWRAQWTIAKSGGYKLCRITRLCIWEKDNVTYQLIGACGFIKRRVKA
jgi:hypothetical protein